MLCIGDGCDRKSDLTFGFGRDWSLCCCCGGYGHELVAVVVRSTDAMVTVGDMTAKK